MNWVAQASRKGTNVTPKGSQGMVEMAAELKKLRKELIETKDNANCIMNIG
jgi:transposase-like protein